MKAFIASLGWLAAVACVGQPSAREPADQPAMATTSAASAKASGSRVAPCSAKKAAAQLIEDAEDGDGSVAFGPHAGGWFNYKDEAGSSTSFGVEAGGAKGSKGAAHMRGDLSRGEVVYAGMGISLGSEPFDASMYKGVSFRAKVAGASTNKVRFTVSDIHTEPAGGVCKNCYNHFGVDLELGQEWAEYSFSFDQMKQGEGWGDRYPELVPNAVYSLGWGVNDKGRPYDVWVDDVLFIGCE